MFFSLSSLELGLLVFGIVLGTTLAGRLPGAAAAHARRRPARAGRRPPGGAARRSSALILAFGLTLAVGRYDARRAAVVDDGERDRHDLPARADSARAGPHAVSRRSSCATRTRASALSRAVPDEPRGSARAIADGDDAAALALAPRRRGPRRRTDRQRAAALRRDAQRDDRHADGAGVGAEQPRARGAVLAIEVVGAAVGARAARALPRDPRARRAHASSSPRRFVSAAPADHVRPRPPGARARHRSRPRRSSTCARRWSCRPRRRGRARRSRRDAPSRRPHAFGEPLPADERTPCLELERVPDRRSDALAAWPAL